MASDSQSPQSIVPIKTENPEHSLNPALTSDIPEEWGINTPKRKETLAKVRRGIGEVKHGILSSIPMICKDNACPYKQHCAPQQRGEVTAGERCVLEIGKLLEWSERYYREFNVDPLDQEQRADIVIIQQLLSTEIVIDRCQMALSTGNLIEEIEVAMNQTGDVITQPMIHKAAELLPKMQRRQNELLGLMVATRKDKLATTGGSGMTVADVMKRMFENAGMARARAELIKAGEYSEAERIGFEYGTKAHEVFELDSKEIESPE